MELRISKLLDLYRISNDYRNNLVQLPYKMETDSWDDEITFKDAKVRWTEFYNYCRFASIIDDICLSVGPIGLWLQKDLSLIGELDYKVIKRFGFPFSKEEFDKASEDILNQISARLDEIEEYGKKLPAWNWQEEDCNGTEC